MLPKHSKDIIFIVIILLLIGVIWGVPKQSWIFILINVIVIMVGILYIKLNGAIESNNRNPKEFNTKNNNFEDSYTKLKEIAGEEVEEFLEEANYEKIEDIIESRKVIKSFIDGEIKLEEALNKIKLICKFKLQIYYLGLSLITMADTSNLNEKDYNYLTLGVEVIKSANIENATKTLRFLKNTFLKINV